jgi:hypothetical protein
VLIAFIDTCIQPDLRNIDIIGAVDEILNAPLSSYSALTSARNDGVVRVKSVYPIGETVNRLKNDIAAKGIVFFSEVDQSQLAAGAGIALRPSVLLTFGNPPPSR